MIEARARRLELSQETAKPAWRQMREYHLAVKSFERQSLS
jgi:hypothetical protein